MTIEGRAQRQLSATHFDAEFSITGSSQVSGIEAFKKTKEFIELQAALAEAGVSGEAIEIERVSLSKKTGKLLSSSEVTYDVIAKKVDLNLLPKVLQVLASRPNIELDELSWHYGELEEGTLQLKMDAARAAKTTASRVAEALGVSLRGIYQLSFKVVEPKDSTTFDTGVRLSKMSAPRAAAPAFERLPLNHTNSLEVTVKVEFTVTEFMDG